MRAEDTLQYMADFYPDIFPTRKHALNHLFCVIGNGFKWINGELVDFDDKYTKRYTLATSIVKAEFKNEDNWYEQHEFWKSFYKETDRMIPIQYDFSWYPLSKKFSYLFNYPDDIAPDWLVLLEECKQMLIEDGIDITLIEE